MTQKELAMVVRKALAETLLAGENPLRIVDTLLDEAINLGMTVMDDVENVEHRLRFFAALLHTFHINEDVLFRFIQESVGNGKRTEVKPPHIH